MPELAFRALRSKGPDQKFTEPVALSSTVPRGLSASAYGPRERLRPTRAPCSVQGSSAVGGPRPFKRGEVRKNCALCGPGLGRTLADRRGAVPGRRVVGPTRACTARARRMSRGATDRPRGPIDEAATQRRGARHGRSDRATALSKRLGVEAAEQRLHVVDGAWARAGARPARRSSAVITIRYARRGCPTTCSRT